MSSQNGWRWCHKCQGFFFSENPSQGVCPAGTSHDASQSGQYAALLGDEIPGAQSGWRWCKKCQGFFFSLNPAKGVCPADHTAHDDSASGHYFPSSLETPCPELKDCGVGVKNARDSSSQGIPPCVLQVARMTAVRAGNMEL